MTIMKKGQLFRSKIRLDGSVDDLVLFIEEYDGFVTGKKMLRGLILKNMKEFTFYEHEVVLVENKKYE